MEKPPYPVLPEHIQNGESATPPPSYEEAMGQYQSSVCKNEQELPPLAYIDILPKCLVPGAVENKIPPKFQSFSEVLKDANAWLQCNPGIRVWKCETVERKVEKGPTIYLDSTLLHEPTYGFIAYVIGLRLWLTKNKDSDCAVQQLGVYNVVPEKKEIPVSYRAGFMGGGMAIGGSFVMAPGTIGRANLRLQSIITYEGLAKTLERINNKFKVTPLPGSILSIETRKNKIAEGFGSIDIDPEVTSWSEKGATTSKRYVHIMRIFYVHGQPANQEIYMHEVKPEMIYPSELSKPAKFEHFQEVLKKTQSWLKCQSGIQILNLDTRDAVVHEAFGNTQVDSDSTDEFNSAMIDSKYLRFIRIFYCPNINMSYTSTMLTSRLFEPVRTGIKSFETMSETMKRVEAYLNLTGLPIMNVETVHYLYNSNYHTGVDVDRSYNKIPQTSAKYWLTTIRLYFPTVYQEPSPLSLPPVKDWKLKDGSSSCSIL
ncbi:uncharacterized protein LOC126826892 isoform X1 [Patella vulgata]|uniref:uncharacterized protein LOC126826892 isoform X1 n=2 Tax=Patella vulgata TaxID=6465 RepID=UPI00217F9438|nr:uncharacterized protein LOC126826892 isoform X1 [Patella vulgata]